MPLVLVGPLRCYGVVPDGDEWRVNLPVPCLRRGLWQELASGSVQFVLPDILEQRAPEMHHQPGLHPVSLPNAQKEPIRPASLDVGIRGLVEGGGGLGAKDAELG